MAQATAAQQQQSSSSVCPHHHHHHHLHINHHHHHHCHEQREFFFALAMAKNLLLLLPPQLLLLPKSVQREPTPKLHGLQLSQRRSQRFGLCSPAQSQSTSSCLPLSASQSLSQSLPQRLRLCLRHSKAKQSKAGLRCVGVTTTLAALLTSCWGCQLVYGEL